MSTSEVITKLPLVLVILVALIHLVNGASVDEDDNIPDYWLKRKQWFHRRTAFELTDHNLELLGPKRLIFENKSAEPKGHLPFWFDYKLYKKVFNKKPKDKAEDEARHNVYINTCLRVLKARVLFRMLAGTSDTFITEDADRFHWEIFGQMDEQSKGHENEEISFSLRSDFESSSSSREDPLDKAIRLVRQEMEIVESRNQVETNLKAFDEVDGSAIRGKLPYKQ